ncbi:serine protease inhibitor family protein, partial [Tanacetum coccineum]
MDFKQLVNNQTHVSITLANHLFSKKCPNTNVVFCPLSIHVALSLIAAGSKGRTLEQLLTFLKSDNVHDINTLTSHLLSLMADGSPSGGPRLSSANGVWIEQTLHLKASFKHVLDNIYNATCKQVDFRTKSVEIVNEVNLWAEYQTSGIIKNILTTDAVDSSTKLIFENAVYFKGVWKEKFNPLNTKYLDFKLLDGSKVKVPFMTSNEEQLVCEYDGFKVLGLPYSQGEDRRRFTMYLYLPNEKDGLQYLIEKMGSESNFLDNYMPHYKREV